MLTGGMKSEMSYSMYLMKQHRHHCCRRRSWCKLMYLLLPWFVLLTVFFWTLIFDFCFIDNVLWLCLTYLHATISIFLKTKMSTPQNKRLLQTYLSVTVTLLQRPLSSVPKVTLWRGLTELIYGSTHPPTSMLIIFALSNIHPTGKGTWV